MFVMTVEAKNTAVLAEVFNKSMGGKGAYGNVIKMLLPDVKIESTEMTSEKVSAIIARYKELEQNKKRGRRVINSN